VALGAPSQRETLLRILDSVALEKWMHQQGLVGSAISSASLLPGGTQNILVRFTRGTQDYILRRPPEHPRANSNETILREARMLTALAGTNIPHPALLATCSDDSVLGAAFYLMEVVDGFNPRHELPLPHAAAPEMRHRMGLALVEGIAHLAMVDYEQLGLGDFGNVEGYLVRQTQRWSDQLADYCQYQGWPGPRSLGDVQAIRNWLDENCPNDFHAGIVHGDYHLSNVMYQRNSPELAAIVDWELTTIGATMVDLGWLLATWPLPDGRQTPGIVGTAPWDGFPTADELITHYSKITGRPTQSMEWYAVLACYKLAILLEGTYARASAGKAAKETGERLHEGAVALLARAKLWAS
jgi:aminoglycoside phosphotransferase (APT) family kinase protein